MVKLRSTSDSALWNKVSKIEETRKGIKIYLSDIKGQYVTFFINFSL